jgi:hypothetical protein
MTDRKDRLVLASLVLPAALALPLSGCGKESAPPAATGEDHADDHDHDHEHATDSGGHAHGEPHPLGEQTLGAMTVQAILEGEATPGKECSFVIHVAGGTPKAVRFWIGAKDDKTAMRVKAELEGEDPGYHAHTEVPSPLADDAKLIVEIESDTGRETVEFDLPR